MIDIGISISFMNSLNSVAEAAKMLGLSPKTVYAGKAGTEKLRKIRNGKGTVSWP